MATIADALTYPMAGDDWLKTLLIGGVLLIFGFLIIPAIVAYGYIVTAIRDSLEGRTAPPAFEDWGDLTKKGVFAWIIGIAYMIIPLIVGGITVGGSIVAMATGTQTGAAAGIVGIAGGVFLTAVLSLVFGYFAVVAVVNFARTGEFAAGFDFTTIKRVAFDGGYFIAWAVSIGLFIVSGFIVGLLNVIPVLGSLVGAFVFFYAQLVVASIWAGGFSTALEGIATERSGFEEPAV